MKIRFASLLIFAVFVASFSTVAQETVPKEVFLNTINGVNELKLSNYKTSELMEYNTGYADRVYDIMESDKTEKDKKDAFKVLKTDKEKDLVDVLGKKDAKKYIKLMEESLKPLIKKDKMFKHLL
jgi:hypothetical protein